MDKAETSNFTREIQLIFSLPDQYHQFSCYLQQLSSDLSPAFVQSFGVENEIKNDFLRGFVFFYKIEV